VDGAAGARARRARALHRDTGDLFQFVIQFSKICNSTKSQLSWKSPKISCRGAIGLPLLHRVTYALVIRLTGKT
jgi:hypothetical protein